MHISNACTQIRVTWEQKEPELCIHMQSFTVISETWWESFHGWSALYVGIKHHMPQEKAHVSSHTVITVDLVTGVAGELCVWGGLAMAEI